MEWPRLSANFKRTFSIPETRLLQRFLRILTQGTRILGDHSPTFVVGAAQLSVPAPKRKLLMHILETPRLILRPPSHSDELLLHGLHSDPFVVNAIRDGVYPTIEQSKASLLQLIDHWQHNRFGLWMVFLKDEVQASRFAGYCGLNRPKNSIYLRKDSNDVEIVTCLHLAASGRGVAVEAGRAVVQFAFEHLNLEKVTSFVRQKNTRSLIKNLKIGFFYVGDVVYKNSIMRRLEVSPITAVKDDNLLVFDYTYPETAYSHEAGH